MTLSRNQLIERLQSAEWTDLEVKEASWAVPRTALETVSATIQRVTRASSPGIITG